MDFLSERVSKRIDAWLKIFRPPNLFSVPGDPLAGFIIAGGASLDPRLIPLVLCSLCAYSFGLLTNDLADLKTDLRERPFRPIPSGALSVASVRAASVALGILSLMFASTAGGYAVYICLLLLLTVLAYNYRAKKSRMAGPVAMGLCRGFNVLLGASVLNSFAPINAIIVVLLALSVTVYIAGVTIAARDETKKLASRPGRAVFLSGACMCYVAVFTAFMTSNFERSLMVYISCFVSAVTSALFVLSVYWNYRLLGQKISPLETQVRIGQLISGLIFLQVAAVSAKCELMIASILVAFIPLSALAARKFYGS